MHVVERFGPVVRIRMAPTLLRRPLLWVNAFVVDGLLIDTGCRRTLPDLQAALKSEGLQVKQLVNTHTHEDHTGGNMAVSWRYKVTPQVHPLGLARLAEPESAAEMDLYRRMYWDVCEPCPGEPLGEVVETDRYRFRVLHTPGHAPDHVALWEEREGWLFSGDLVLSPRLNRIRRHEDPVQALASLRLLAGLPVRRLFCSHAYKVADSPAPILGKIAFWEGLQQKAGALTAKGLDAAKVANDLLGPPGLTEWFTRGDLSKVNLIEGLLKNA
jgi:glyoxylase-like metal-dependent hydrolase (beta-lactamase superfamily II)